jgi:hypothetical protein
VRTCVAPLHSGAVPRTFRRVNTNPYLVFSHNRVHTG